MKPVLKAIFDVGHYLVFFIFFMLADLIGYYRYSDGHSLVPLIISGLLTIVVLIIGLMAFFEEYKHRNDKETW